MRQYGKTKRTSPRFRVCWMLCVGLPGGLFRGRSGCPPWDLEPME